MFGKKLAISLIGGAALLTALPASATTYEELTFNDMVNTASACVVGDVVSSVTEKRNGSVVTLTTFKVRDLAFGSVGSKVTVVTPGGATKMGKLNVAEVVAGSPMFLNGQESLMLLSANSGSNEFQIMGLNQGLFRVSQGANGADLVALPDSIGGTVNVDEAVDLIREQRIAPNRLEVGQ